MLNAHCYYNMKRLLIILLFLTSNSLAQERFSKLYNSVDKGADLATEILVLKDGYLFCSSTRGGTLPDTLNYSKQFLFIVKTKKNGDTIWTKQYYRKAFGIGANKLIQMTDSTFLLAGRIIDYVAYKDSNIKRDVFLIKINSKGDTLWTKTISLGRGDELVSNIYKTLDGGYAIYGQTCNQSVSDCDNFLIKLDSNANLIFTKKYSFNASSFEQPGGIIDLSDTSIYLFGNTQNAIAEEAAYLIKTNKYGKIIWQKKYGFDGKRRLGVSIKKHSNGLILNITKATDLPDSADPLLIKIDTSGNIIWQKTYASERNNVIYDICVVNDSLIYGAGDYKGNSLNDNTHACILKINNNGDTIWQKIYSFNNINILDDRNTILYGIKTDGKSILTIGYGYNKSNVSSGQDIFVLKLDSMGCLYENCITPTGIVEVKNKQELIIYPNPANNNFKFAYSTNIKSYKLIDYTGRIILQGEYSDNGVNVEQLPSGIYMVQVVLEDNKIAFAKLLKE